MLNKPGQEKLGVLQAGLQKMPFIKSHGFFFPPLKIFNRTVVEVQLCSEQSGFQQDTNVINASVVDGTGKIHSAWLAPSQPISVLGSVCMRSLLQIEELH